MRPNPSILIVEDNARDLELMLAAVAQVDERVRTDVARDGLEALDHLGRIGDPADRPALTILDIKLPRLSGHEVLRRARASERFAHIPIVVMSGSQLPADIAQAYELGANGYVQKPIGYRDLVGLVRATLEFWLGHNLPPAPLAA